MPPLTPLRLKLPDGTFNFTETTESSTLTLKLVSSRELIRTLLESVCKEIYHQWHCNRPDANSAEDYNKYLEIYNHGSTILTAFDELFKVHIAQSE